VAHHGGGQQVSQHQAGRAGHRKNYLLRTRIRNFLLRPDLIQSLVSCTLYDAKMKEPCFQDCTVIQECNQCCGSGSGIYCFFFTPGSEMGKKFGSGTSTPDHVCGSGILCRFDTGSEMGKSGSGIRSKLTGSATRDATRLQKIFISI